MTEFTQEPEGDSTRFTAKRIIAGEPLSDLDLFERKKQQMTYSPK